ncbi:MAG: hypothetical protein Q8K59_13300 [Nitrosomonas sp.]|nr:hypothetical protein [Moraxellaceae bacterium]MDP1952032.1 hypothetical protein [Nitrosomonas sp.]
MKNLHYLEKPIKLLSLLAFSCTLWQAVKLSYYSVLTQPVEGSLFKILDLLVPQFFGIAGWIIAGYLILLTGQVAAIIVSVGWRQFIEEKTSRKNCGN